MKKILVPTDFSETAFNAALYAVDLANEMNAEIHLLHVDHIPNPLKSLPVEIILTPDELKSDSESHLKQMQAELREKRKLPAITIATRNDSTIAGINQYANFIGADLIVIGLQGSGFLKEKVIGSTATSLPEHSEIPVLIIPPDSSFEKPSRITFASNGDDLGNENSLKTFLELAKHFNSKLEILNILSPRDLAEKDRVVEQLEKVFRGMEHKYHFPEINDVSQGIHDFIESNQSVWLVTIPRKHTFFGHLFGKSHTIRLAFHNNIPLLALPS